MQEHPDEDDPISNLINNYHDLNAHVVDTFDEDPSALEFMRYVAKNRPFKVRRSALQWDAVRKWDADYLHHAMAGERVRVAVTPRGNADAVVEEEEGNGRMLFVQPHEVSEPFGTFLNHVRESSVTGGAATQCNVKYAQSQNDNLRSEYQNIFADVPGDIPFARIALEKEPEAINFWLGNERSVTALHKDNYENLYFQIRGRKHFVLLPPVELPCVNEQALPPARYHPAENGDARDESLVVAPFDDEDRVPVPTWDPDDAEKNATEYSRLSRPLRVTLEEGDMLYLPAMWYHKVTQSVGREGFACAVNMWYDMDYGGGFWANMNFVREMSER